MCGITGIFNYGNNITKPDISGSVNALLHRGPDNNSIWEQDNIALGHTRLSVIDLSENANQPMFSKSGNSVIVFNGEIYNYKQIAGIYNIKSGSDTEILLEAFEKTGPSIFEKLNGMFAFVIYNIKSKTLYLARDRIGIKPLFYYSDNNIFAFASELKSLLKIQYINNKKRVNKSSISQFLNFGYIPEADTFFENIKKFPSGCFGCLTDKKQEIDIKPYWTIEDNILPQTLSNFSKAKQQLDLLLNKSVEHRMISDVPLGTFLSGGIDSGLITSIAQKISEKPVKTFTIGFKDNDFNEAAYAKNIAKYLRTDHHEFIVSEKDVLELVDDFFNTYDEPFADSSGFPTLLVSKLARKYVTVILSGDGGDELFHGYGAYKWAKRLNNPLLKTFRQPVAAILSTQSNRYKRAAGLFRYENGKTLKSHIFSQEQYFFSIPEIKKLLVNNNTLLKVDENIVSPRKLTKTEEQSVFDIKNYLKDDLLTKVDRASMTHSLEVRVPMLDHNVVEFALNLHPSLKINKGEQKFLLKQLLYDYIPEKYFARPKQGFAIPLSKWLKNELYYLIEKYLSEDMILKFNIVKYGEVQNLIKKYLTGQVFLYNRLWILIVLHYNLYKYFNE